MEYPCMNHGLAQDYLWIIDVRSSAAEPFFFILLASLLDRFVTICKGGGNQVK